MEIHRHSAARERSSTVGEDMEVTTIDGDIDAETGKNNRGESGSQQKL